MSIIFIEYGVWDESDFTSLALIHHTTLISLISLDAHKFKQTSQRLSSGIILIEYAILKEILYTLLAEAEEYIWLVL